MRWCVVLAAVLWLSAGREARGDKIALIHGSVAPIDVQAFLTPPHTVTMNPTDFAGLDTVILLTNSGFSSTNLVAFVANGGRLITDGYGAAWALGNGVKLLPASDNGWTFIQTGTVVEFTEAGAGLKTNSAGWYTDAGRTEYFRGLSVNAPGAVQVLAERPSAFGSSADPDVPAIIGGKHGDGNVLVIGYDWADSFSQANSNTKQLLRNALQYEAVPLPAAVWGGLSLLGLVAGRRMWRQRGRRLNGERTV